MQTLRWLCGITDTMAPFTVLRCLLDETTLGHLAADRARLAAVSRRRGVCAALDGAHRPRLPGEPDGHHDVAAHRRACRRTAALCRCRARHRRGRPVAVS